MCWKPGGELFINLHTLYKLQRTVLSSFPFLGSSQEAQIHRYLSAQNHNAELETACLHFLSKGAPAQASRLAEDRPPSPAQCSAARPRPSGTQWDPYNSQDTQGACILSHFQTHLSSKTQSGENTSKYFIVLHFDYLFTFFGGLCYWKIIFNKL